jgi:DNA-binding CsgD family transcriptional regulator
LKNGLDGIAGVMMQEESEVHLLDGTDVRNLTGLLSDLIIVDGDLLQKRRWLLGGLAALIEADCWMWTPGQVDAESRAIPVGGFYGGMTDTQVTASLRATSDTVHPSPLNGPMSALMMGGAPFVRRRQDVVDDATWYASENVKRYYLANDMDHVMYAVEPVSEGGFNGVSFRRALGRPTFSRQHMDLVAMVMARAPWVLHSEVNPESRVATLELSPRLRVVLGLLVKGHPCGAVADLLGLSPNTVKGYMKELYRHFDVRSQLQLIRLTSSDSGGPDWNA